MFTLVFGLVKTSGVRICQHVTVTLYSLRTFLNESIEKTKEIIEKNGSNVEDIEDASKEKSVSAQYFIHSLKIRVKRILYSVGEPT